RTGLRRAPRGDVVQPGAEGDGRAGAGSAVAAGLGRRDELRGLGGGVGGPGVGGAGMSTQVRAGRRRPVEPLFWLLFSAGGVVTALMVPVLLLLFGVVFPLGWVSYPDHAHLLAVVGNPISRLVLLGLCVL